MIINQQCDICKNGLICKARTKLKSFTEDAKVDLGVTLRFEECANFIELNNNVQLNGLEDEDNEVEAEEEL